MLPATDKQVQDTHPAKAGAFRAMTHFPLLRRFSIVSLVVMLSTAVILVLLYRQDQLAEYKIISSDENERTLLYLTSSLDEPINDFVGRSAGLSVPSLQTDASLDSLFSSGLKAINEDDILKLKIYSLAGMTIYSSAKSEIGGTSLHPDILARALHGETVHHMEYLPTLSGKNGEMQDIDVSITYMPLTHAGKIIGAIEIYDNATQLYQHIFTNLQRIVLIVFGAFGALYAALFFSLLRTDRSIVKWQDTLANNDKILRETQIIAGLGSYVLNISTGQWESSDVLNKLFGINESYERSIDGLIALIHPDDREMMADYFKNEVLGSGKDFDKEYRIIRHDDQSVRWVHGLGRQELDAHGHPLKMLGTIQDITERKQIEVALRESESQRHLLVKQKIVQTSLDGFWIANAQSGQLLEVNDHYCKTVGYSREEILAMSIQDLEAQETPDETAAHLKKIREIGYDRFETRHRHKQGHLLDFEVSVSHSEENGGIDFVFFHDITERKRVENTIRESENKFRALFESANDCILILDLNGCIQDINHTGHERLGYTKEEMLGKRISQFDPPDFAAKVAGRMTEIQDKGYATFESSHVRKDGSVMPVEINARTVEINSQQCVLSIIRDITERKQAEAALQTSEANLRAMLDNSPYLTWLKDTEGRYITINKVYAAWLRLDDPMQAIGKTDLDFQPKEMAEKYRADDAEVMATGQQKHVEEQALYGNNIHWVETYKTPIIDAQGKMLGTAGFAKDITERKNFEKFVSDNEKRFRLLAESMPQIVWISQPDGKNVYNNQKWVDYTGLSLEASYGHGWFDAFYPDDALRVKNAFRDAANPKEPFSLECRIRDASEKYNWWLVRGVPVLDETGNIQQWYGTCTDINDIKQAEHDLRVAAVTVQDIMENNKLLTQEVSRRNADLSALTAHIQKIAETEKASLARELHDELGSTLVGLSMEIGRLRGRGFRP